MSVKQVDLAKLWGLSRSRICQMCKDGMPLTSREEAEHWRLVHYGGHGSKIKNTSTTSDGRAVPVAPEPVDEEMLAREDLHGTLARLKKNELAVWRLLADAIAMDDAAEVQFRTKQYKAAAELRVQTEGKVDAILLARKELITLDEAQELLSKVLQPLRVLLKALPSQLAAKCNPGDPILAKKELRVAIEKINDEMGRRI